VEYTYISSIYLAYGPVMALNIKNPEADRLVREIAATTHTSYTEVVLTALREKLAREVGRRSSIRLREEVARIQERMAQLPTLDPRKPDEILGYDDDGVPR
jgi:antitoxin VapB